MTNPTGEQFVLSHYSPAGELRATVTEVGAGIREMVLDGIALVQSFDASVQPPFGAGMTLVPWPNRVRDGLWVDEAGASHQLALSEVERHNAIHGLLRFTPYSVVERTESGITLFALLFPQTGYPFSLEHTVRYELVDTGLTVSNTVKNVTRVQPGTGELAAPVALGAHPYFLIGDVDTTELVVTVNADTHIDVDERLNPIGLTPVAGTGFDLRADSPLSRRVGDLTLDDGWCDSRFTDGITRHTVTAPDGRTVGMWADENYPFVQVFITPLFPERGTDAVTTAIAIEPMTAAADAFNSGHGLKRLSSGEEWHSQWGIEFAGFASV